MLNQSGQAFRGHSLVMKGWGGNYYASFAINTTIATGFTTSVKMLFVTIKYRPKNCMAVQNIRKRLYSSD